METNWAAENLQTIRTLMERSALYRRTLAPLMMVNGCIGLLAAIGGYALRLETNRAFSLYWVAVGALALLVSFLMVRRQALKDAEPFWSPPTRRITQALVPTLLAGLAAGGVFIISPAVLPPATWLLAVAWTTIYGFALHAAGFFMQRGIKLLGWGYILSGSTLFYVTILVPETHSNTVAQSIMGVFFGLLHLAYSIYLYFTEKRGKAA